MDYWMKRIWYLAIPEWRKMLLASFWAFLTVASSVGLMMCSGYILTYAALRPGIAVLSVAIVGVRFFGIARGAFRWLDRMVAHDTALRLLERFRIWFYYKLEPLVPVGIRDLRSGELFHALARDVDSLEFLYARVIAPPLVALWTLLLMAFLLGMHSFLYFSIFASIQFFVIAFCLFLIPSLRRNSRRAQALATELQAIHQEMEQGIHELAIANTTAHWREEALLIEAQYNETIRKNHFLVNFGEALLPLLSMTAVAAMTWLGAQEVIHGQLNAITWVTLVLGIWAGLESVLGFPAMAHALQSSEAAGLRLLAITDRIHPSDSQCTAQDLSNRPTTLLSIQNIGFTWPDGGSVFQQFSLNLDKGESLALLGDSGAGKSTIVQILSHFLIPSSGQIWLEGQNMATMQGDEIRQRISVLEQTPHIFTGTLSENLLLAKQEATAEEQQSVLEKVNLWTWACQQNPDKPLQSWVGLQGQHLSGGQRQRLACARILLRESPLVILDEPTTHLDTGAQESILDVFLALVAKKEIALLVITHRRDFLQRFTRISILGV
jgi:ATP-binding cassette subfamily C protein CydC